LVAALDSSDSNGHIISYDSSDRKSPACCASKPSAPSRPAKSTATTLWTGRTDPIGNRFAMAGEFSSDGKGNLLAR